MKGRPDAPHTGLVVGRNAGSPGARSRAQEKPLKDGQVRCDVCGMGVWLRQDDTPKAHRNRGVPCPGAPAKSSNVQMCKHNNYPGGLVKGCDCFAPRAVVPAEPQPLPPTYSDWVAARRAKRERELREAAAQLAAWQAARGEQAKEPKPPRVRPYRDPKTPSGPRDPDGKVPRRVLRKRAARLAREAEGRT